MTKTISQIYRLAFILFYIWAAFESVFLSGGGLVGAFSDLALLTDTLCFFAVAAAFIFSVMGKIPRAVIRAKAAAAAPALLLLVLHGSIFLTPSADGWILKILLPAMMALDYLLFDTKGTFRLYDPLLWLLALCLLFALWSLFSGRGLDFSLLAAFFGGADRIIPTLLATLLAGGLMLGIDRLLAGKSGLRPRDLFCLLYRILFLLLTGRALYEAGGGSLLTFFFSLKRFAVLAGFLCFLAIAVVLIFCIVQLRKARGASPFPRLKGAFTLLAAAAVFGYHFFIKGGFPAENAWKILLYISPVMMMFDWILFDAKGKFRPYDPLWWAAIPWGYCAVCLAQGTLFALYPALSAYAPELLFCGGILLPPALGYGIYLLDLCLKHKA